MRVPENLQAEGEDRETLAEIRDLKLAPINMKLLLWPRNGLPRATLHYRNWNWIFRMGNSWDILICCSPQTIDHHSLSLWIPPHRSLLLVAFPIVKLTNLWRKHVAIPVGSYCTSVYFDGHWRVIVRPLCRSLWTNPFISLLPLKILAFYSFGFRIVCLTANLIRF